jgi:hypothetical protein
MDNKNNSSRLIISIVSRLHLWLCSCPAELVPASTTVIRARKNKKTKTKTNKKKLVVFATTFYNVRQVPN